MRPAIRRAKETSRPSAASGSRWRATTEIFSLLGPATLLTGILFYFGYVSARSFYTYFGVSLSALDYSPTGYLVRTADTFFRPVATLLVVLLAALGLHLALGHLLPVRKNHVARWLAASLCATGLVAATYGLMGIYGWLYSFLSPLALACSTAALEYGILLAVRYGSLPAHLQKILETGVFLRRGLLIFVALTAVFWAVTIQAFSRGIVSAKAFEGSLSIQSQAVVYSEKNLHLFGPGIGTTNLNDPEGIYHYRYNGLRPLLYANGRWFLVPVGWTHDNGATVIVLQDDPTGLRVDLAPGRLPQP
jgi:hypothetical protein